MATEKHRRDTKVLGQVKKESLNAILSKALKTTRKNMALLIVEKKKIVGEMSVKWNLIFNEHIE